MKKALNILFTLVLSIALLGCSSGQPQDGSSNNEVIPNYTLVDTNDVSIPGTTRVVYWVATDAQVTASTAQTIALDASAASTDIDEVTVWIYDNVDGAKQGLIWDQMYQIEIQQGKVIDTIENSAYDPDYEFDAQPSAEGTQQSSATAAASAETDVSEVDTAVVLAENEYYIYENGEAIAALSDYNTKTFMFSVPSIDNDDNEIVFDLDGHDIATKRGIMMGSTIREFVNAYQYCEITLVDQGLTTTAENFLENFNSYIFEDKYVITMSTNYTNDGQVLCNSEWDQYVKDNKIDISDYITNPQNYCEKVFRIDFVIEDSMISNIVITDMMGD